MKKIKIFIVTYKRSDVLNELLENIYSSDFKDIKNTEVNIINNHTNFQLNDKYKNKVKVYHNMCRPDWSCGNLGQNWNQAIILGFKSIRNPDAEYIVTLQNDCVLHKNWCSHLLKMHKKYDFIAGEFGDNIVSYNINTIKKVGLWDENYQGVAHKEADYYLRVLYFMKNKCLINDKMHKRIWNPNNDYLKLDIPDGRNINDDLVKRPDNKENEIIWEGCRGGVINDYCYKYFEHKWSNTHKLNVSKDGWIKNWNKELITNPPKPKKYSMFMLYPYFEKDIENLKEKGYWIPKDYTQKHWDSWEKKQNNCNKDIIN